MAELTVKDVIKFFEKLNLRDKIAFLSQLANLLNEEVANKSPTKRRQSDDEWVDELFGVWANEENLTEETIINRSISNRVINLDD